MCICTLYLLQIFSSTERITMDSRLEEMTADQLTEQLKRLRDNLCDLEDLHSFTFNKTSLHIGSEKAQAMQDEFEMDCESYKKQISEIERVLLTRQGCKG
ncbi:MAG: hypothetical protein C0402_13850 [Thermodesulfovibrio sp.]|nr:hypothetical protein [Thermodesulfovibrio sp.]